MNKTTIKELKYNYRSAYNGNGDRGGSIAALCCGRGVRIGLVGRVILCGDRGFECVGGDRPEQVYEDEGAVQKSIKAKCIRDVVCKIITQQFS